MASETDEAARIVADEANSEQATAQRVMDADGSYMIGTPDDMTTGSNMVELEPPRVADTPDTPTEYEAIRSRAAFLRSLELAEIEWVWGIWRQHIEQDWPVVLAENERLQRDNARLHAALESQTRGMGYLNEACRRRDKMIAALREIAQTVASLWGLDDCSRGNEFPQRRVSLYSHDGAVDVAELREQARALLADTPTTRLDATQRNNDE